MNLSPHFSLAEFEITTHREIMNLLPDELFVTAQATCNMLEQIRDFLCTVDNGRDIPIFITSGYRCLELNRAIGSQDTSDHILAMAVDWHAPAFGSPAFIATAMAPHIDELGIGQLIFEFGSWVHCSTKIPANPINRVLTIDNRGTQAGIVPLS